MSRLDVDAKFYADLECVRVFFQTHSATFGPTCVLFVNDIEQFCTNAKEIEVSPTFFCQVRTRLAFLQGILLAVVDQDVRDRFVHFTEVCGKIQMMLNNLQFVEEDMAKKANPVQRSIRMPNGCLYDTIQHVLLLPEWVAKGFGERS